MVSNYVSFGMGLTQATFNTLYCSLLWPTFKTRLFEPTASITILPCKPTKERIGTLNETTGAECVFVYDQIDWHCEAFNRWLVKVLLTHFHYVVMLLAASVVLDVFDVVDLQVKRRRRLAWKHIFSARPAACS